MTPNRLHNNIIFEYSGNDPSNSEDEDPSYHPATRIQQGKTTSYVNGLSKLVKDPLISKWGFRVDSTNNHLVCLECYIGVPLLSAKKHRNTHSKQRIGLPRLYGKKLKEFWDHIHDTFPDLEALDTSILIPAESPPLPGIIFGDGFRCRLCTYCTPLRASVSKHIRQTHPEASKKEKEPIRCIVQTRFRSSLTKHHIVSASDLSPSLLPLASQVLKILAADSLRPPKLSTSTSPENSWDVDQFPKQLGWLRHIEHFDSETLMALVQPVSSMKPSPKQLEFRALVKGVHVYFKLAQNYLDKAPNRALREINSPTSE